MKKFLICLLVVAIALLGFTGCPSPASDDSGDSGPVNSVDDSIPELAELREITSMTVDYNTSLSHDDVALILSAVAEIEDGDYGERNSTNIISSGSTDYPEGRAAEDYSYEDNQSYAYGYVHKGTNYPVFYADYSELYPRWTKALPDGWLAPGDVYEVTGRTHRSEEYSDITVKKDDKDGSGTGLGVGISNVLDKSGSVYKDKDIHIDGKYVKLFDQDYSNEYTKVSDDHKDYYYTRNGTNSTTVKRAYAVDVSDPSKPTEIQSGGFKISYTYTDENSFDDLKLKYIGDGPEEGVAPYFEPELTDPLGFSVYLEIYGKRNINSDAGNKPIILDDEESLLKVDISAGSTWQDLVNVTKRSFIRKTNGAYTASSGSLNKPDNVDTDVLDWLLADSPYGSFAASSSTIGLPDNIKKAITVPYTAVP